MKSIKEEELLPPVKVPSDTMLYAAFQKISHEASGQMFVHAISHQLASADFLLLCGVDPLSQHGEGLLAALQLNDEGVYAQHLIELSTNFSTQLTKRKLEIILERAALKGYIPVMEWVFEKGAALKKPLGVLDFPIAVLMDTLAHSSGYYKTETAIRWLLEEHKIPLDRLGEKILAGALQGGNRAVIELLLDYGVSPDTLTERDYIHVSPSSKAYMENYVLNQSIKDQKIEPSVVQKKRM